MDETIIIPLHLLRRQVFRQRFPLLIERSPFFLNGVVDGRHFAGAGGVLVERWVAEGGFEPLAGGSVALEDVGGIRAYRSDDKALHLSVSIVNV